MKIVLTASEIVPFSKSGGMADVVGALAGSLARRGHQVLTVSPKYGSFDAAAAGFKNTGLSARVDIAWQTYRPRFHTKRDPHGVTHALVEHAFFDRAGLYGDDKGSFGDNHLRFALLSRAAIEAARIVPVGRRPLGQDVVFHAHDWQTSLVPVYLNALYRPLGLFPKAPTVLTLHNLAHQGIFSAAKFGDLELAARWFGDWGLEWYGNTSLLKAGILQAEQLTTVSPTYARQIVQDGGAFGMEGPLRHRAKDLTGILNGIDTGVWNPADDPHLDTHYSADAPAGKAACKAALQAEFGLPVAARTPIVGMVGRIDPQKGVHWIVESIPWLVEQGAQVVILGSAVAAHRALEDQVRAMEHRYRRNVRAWIGFSERMAHRIEAGVDLFMMPSVFEPCGLNQLYSLRYGTVPVVRATGGLADSVRPYNPAKNTGNGWTFLKQDGPAFREALFHALYTYKHHPASFAQVRARGMAEDHSWDASAPDYEDVYRKAGLRLGAELA